MYYDIFIVKAYIKIGRFIQAKFFSHIITVAKIGFISPGYKNIEAMEKVELKVYIEPFVLHAHRNKIVKLFYQNLGLKILIPWKFSKNAYFRFNYSGFQICNKKCKKFTFIYS